MNKSILDQQGWIDLFKRQPGSIATLSESPRAVVFWNPTNHNSMRLTKFGILHLQTKLKIQAFNFKLDKPISPKVILQLERQLKHPYFIFHLKKIIVFDEATAIMLQLHGNDLETYLDNLEKHK